MSNARISVAVFAHNEADNIAKSIAAIKQAGLGPADRITILVNGSTDATHDIAQDLAQQDSRITVINTPFGDKANAWNIYAHDVADPSIPFHAFIDGDVQISAQAFPAVADALDANPQALAASTMPEGGRQAQSWRARIIAHHGMPGNFYVLRGQLLGRMKHGFWIPVGLFGDDTLLRWMILRDMDPSAPPVPDRILPVQTASFHYQSLSRRSFSGLRALYKRHRAYAKRDIYIDLLCDRLTEKGLAAMPKHISVLNPEISAPRFVFRRPGTPLWRRGLMGAVAAGLSFRAPRPFPPQAFPLEFSPLRPSSE